MSDYILQLLNSNLIMAFCTLFSGFGGALAGSLVTAKSLRREEHKRLVAEYNAEFVSAYSTMPYASGTIEGLQKLIAAIEKLRLFCPPETEQHFNMLFNSVLKEEIDIDACRIAYDEIQSAVKKIIRS